MKYATVASGAEAPSVAWKHLDWEPVFFSEIDPFASKILSHHYPEVPNLGDMTKINGNQYHGTIDLIFGGTPCQSFSIAGLRKGLSDQRGNLSLEFLRLVDEIRPTWVAWENVVGVLSSNQGRDFGTILGALSEIGYWWAYRVLDAQYFGVPQRRRRVFIVGHSSKPQYPAAVLFDSKSLQGHTSKSRKPVDKAPSEIKTSAGVCGKNGKGESNLDKWPSKKTLTLTADFGKHLGLNYQHIQNGASFFVMATGQSNAEIVENIVPTLTSNHEQPIVFQTHFAKTDRDAMDAQNCIVKNVKIRRIMPVEAERLMGFPDNYTNILSKNGRSSPDGARYKIMGNSIVVPVLKWIGNRINIIHNIQ